MRDVLLSMSLRNSVWSTFSSIRFNPIGNCRGRRTRTERGKRTGSMIFCLVSFVKHCGIIAITIMIIPMSNPSGSPTNNWKFYSVFSKNRSVRIVFTPSESIDLLLPLLQVRQPLKRPMTRKWISWTKNCGTKNISPLLHVSTNVWRKEWNISIPFRAMHDNRFQLSSLLSWRRSENFFLHHRFDSSFLSCLSKRRFSCRLFIFLHSSSPVGTDLITWEHPDCLCHSLFSPPNFSLDQKDERTIRFFLSQCK